MSFFISLAAGACLALGAATPLFAEELSGKQKVEIEKVVHDYLIANPEVVREAIDELGKREKVAEAATREKAVGQHGDKIVNSPNQAVVGNPSGDVTLVEFFDYNCGYCKQSMASVAKLIEADPKLRVVLKDFPILGPDSVEAAQVATAARMQLDSQKFWEFPSQAAHDSRPHRQAAGAGGGEGGRRRYAPSREGHVERGDKGRTEGSRDAGR